MPLEARGGNNCPKSKDGKHNYNKRVGRFFEITDKCQNCEAKR